MTLKILNLFLFSKHGSSKIRIFVSMSNNYSMLYFLILKNLNAKYRGSFLGALWNILSPLGMLFLYCLVFGSTLYASNENYWVYMSIGIFPFFFFQSNMICGAMCIINESELLKKKKFPRIFIVLAEVVATFIVFTISYILMLIIFFILEININLTLLLWVPLYMILSFIFAFGLALQLSIITVYIRDVQHIIDTFSRVFFWITPLFFYFEDISNNIFRNIILCNPYTYFIELFHSTLFYNNFPEINYLIISSLLAIFALVLGYILFKKYEAIVVEEL